MSAGAGPDYFCIATFFSKGFDKAKIRMFAVAT
jgi:hypothetical protein